MQDEGILSFVGGARGEMSDWTDSRNDRKAFALPSGVVGERSCLLH